MITAGAGAAAGADYPTTVMSLNPAMYYRLNETAAVPASDSGMVTNSGTLGALGNGPFSGAYGTNGYIRGVAGALVGDSDTAAAFYGGSANIPYAAALNPGAPFTVECWANPTAIEGSQFPVSPFAGITATVGRAGWIIYQNADSWQFRIGDTNGYVAQPAGGSAAVGTWSHVVGVYDGNMAYLYVDGEQVDSASESSPFMPNPSQTTDIGTGSAFGRTFGGAVDEAAIYTNALSAAEIKAHYQNGISAARTTPYSQLILAQHPIAYYRLNEPAWTIPATTELPVVVNRGKLGAAANGVFNPGVESGVAGDPLPGFGANNLAARFNGRVGNITVPPQSLVTAELTILCWVKRSGNQLGSAALIFTRNLSTSGTATGFGFNDINNLRLHWNDNEYDWDSGFTVPDNTWTFTALVVTPEQSVIYMNDQSVTNEATHAEHDFSVAPILIGQDPCCGIRIPNAVIDEPAIFDRALSREEILQIYAAAGVVSEVSLKIQKTATGVEIQWPTGTLEAADAVKGTYQTVPGATAPSYTVAPGGTAKFYRVKL